MNGRWKRVATFAALLMLGLIPTSHADVLFMQERCNFILEGTLTAADVAQFTSTSCNQNDAVKIWIRSSPGGDAEAAMAIGRWARARNASVFLDPGAYCYSSCALVYIAGVYRVALGELGLHRPYLAGAPNTPAEVVVRVNRMLADVRAYVEEMGITPDFTHVMLNTPPDRMRRYRDGALMALVPGADLLHDEVQTAKAAQRYEIPTEEYRRRKAESIECGRPYDPNNVESVLASFDYECESAVMWGLSRSVYRARNAAADEQCKHLDIKSEEEWEEWRGKTGRFRPSHPEMQPYYECRKTIMLGR